MYCCVIEYPPCQEAVLKKCNYERYYILCYYCYYPYGDVVPPIRDDTDVIGHVKS